MRKLELRDDLLTGLQDIDFQHKTLFEWGNRVLLAVSPGVETDLFLKALRFLQRYVEYHLAAEELAMATHQFPGLPHHRSQHSHFREEVRELRLRAEAEGPTKELRARLHFMLHDWFAYHIEYSDKRLAGFLRERREADEHALPIYGASDLDLAILDEMEVVPLDGQMSATERKLRARKGR